MKLFLPLCRALFFGAPPCAAAPNKPNVLMIAVDDLNDWVGCLGGHPQAKTPNLKIFGILAQRYRNARSRYTLIFKNVAGLHNWMFA